MQDNAVKSEAVWLKAILSYSTLFGGSDLLRYDARMLANRLPGLPAS